MSRLVDRVVYAVDTNTSGSQTCALTDLEYQAGDLLLAYVCHGWYNTNLSCSTSGWQQVGGTDFTENLVGYMQEGWFFKIAASSSETDPTFTANTSSGAWRITISSVRGVNQTTPISAWNANGISAGKPTAYTATNYRIDAPVCAAPAGALLFYSISSYSSSYSWGLTPYVPIQYGKFLSNWYVTAANPQQGSLFYGVNVATGGNSPSFYINMAYGGTSMVIAINDAATTEIEPHCKSGALLLRAYMGVSDNATWVAPQTATGNITIDGCTLASTFTAVIEQYRSTVMGAQFQYHKLNDSTLGTGSPVLVGRMDSYTFPDFSGRVIGIKYGFESLPSTKVGTKGISLVLVDASGGVSLYNLRRFADLLYLTQMVCMIDHSITPTDVHSVNGAANWASIRYAGLLVDRVTADTYGLVWACQEFQVIDNWVLVGGSADNPLSPVTVGDIYRNNVAVRAYTSQQGSGQLLAYAGFQIGDGSTPTYFKLTGGSIENAPASNTDVRIPAQTQDYTIKPSANCTMDFSSGIVRFNVRQTWSIHADANASCSHTFVGASFIGADIVWHAGFACVSASFSGCYTVDGKTRKLDKATFSACRLTSGAYLRLDGGGSGTESGAINSTFTKGGESYAVELRTAGYYDFTGTTFNGYLYELYVSAASGTVSIKLATGQTQPDVYNPNGCTIFWDAPTVDVTFTPVAGSQLIVFAAGTTTEILNVASTGTSEVWSGASGAYDYTIMKAGYLPVRGSGASPTASITIDPQQKIDRAYVASSGLIMTGGTPNCSANTGTQVFGLTADSTLQNFYSYMIEQWISNTALRNQTFPIVPNGPSSFRFIDWTWDGDTSIDHLSRDGMQYYDSATSTATDIWAAILSVGVPAGMQVRYQQQDGLGTTNAQNTGNIDQLIKIKKTGAGAFDYTNWLVLKVQQEGYDQAEAVAVDIYGTLEDQLYVVGLTPLANGIAAQAGITGVTITSEPTPVLWNGQYFSTTITDTTDTHSGLQIMQYVRSLNNFNLHDMIRANGAKFKTVTGNVYGDTLTTPAGVRVVKADGTTPHPDFDVFIADSGGSYVPDVVAPITWAGALNGTTVLLYNDSNAGAIIDTQAVSGAGGYEWTISLPHVDVAVGDSLRLRYGHKEYYAGELQGTMTASGLAFVGSMTLHPIYAGWALDGATYDQANGGPYVMDGTNLQVDIAAGATTGLKTQLGAWTQYLMTLPAGLDAFYGAWDLLALNQIRQNVAVVDVMIDVPTAGALFTFTDNNVNYYRSDFTFPGNVQAGHGLIAMTYNAEPFVATVTGGNVVTGDQSSIVAAVFAQAGVTPIHSDIQKVNGYEVTGNGQTGSEWGPSS